MVRNQKNVIQMIEEGRKMENKKNNNLTPKQLKELTEAITKSLPPMFDSHDDCNWFFSSTPADYESPQDYYGLSNEFESWKSNLRPQPPPIFEAQFKALPPAVRYVAESLAMRDMESARRYVSQYLAANRRGV